MAISIHALLAESDLPAPTSWAMLLDISIHALLAESDSSTRKLTNMMDISIHALLAESDTIDKINYYLTKISIHALLAESDLNCSRNGFAIRYFYPRSPCGERQ